MTTLTRTQLETLVDSILLSSLEHYAAETDESSLLKLQSWLEEHGQDENLFAEVVQTFPKFGEFLVKDMEAIVTREVQGT